MNKIENNPIKALFFKIEGTLAYQQKDIESAQDLILRMIDVLGVDCQPADFAQKLIKGESEYQTWREKYFVDLAPEEKWSRFLLSDFPKELIREHAYALEKLWCESQAGWQLAEGVVNTLQELSDRGYILATISLNSLKHLQDETLKNLFCARVRPKNTKRYQPHSGLLLEAAAQCNLSPDECAYIGDRPSRDVIGAREAGLREVILLKNQYTTEDKTPCPMQADAQLSDMIELLDCYPPLNGSNAHHKALKISPVLFDAALSTINWNRERISINEFFEIGRELGFARFELNHQIPLEVYEQIDFNRYYISSLHNPCPAIEHMKKLEKEDKILTSVDEKLRQVGVDVLKNTIEHAYRLGARNIVIHSGRVTGDESMDLELRKLFRAGKQNTHEFRVLRERMIADRKERGKPHLEALVRSLSEIVGFAEGTNILLGIENLMYYYEFPTFEEIQVLLETFDQPWIGWHFDVGHLEIMANLGLESIPHWLDTFDKRMVGIHLHDVNGIDDHFAPGDGKIDFSAVGPRLQPFTQVTVEVKPFVSTQEIRAGLPVLEDTGCITRL